MTLKKHPIASLLYTLYLLLWCWLAYIGYNDLTHHGDGESIGTSLYYFCLFVFLPYFIINFLLSLFSRTGKEYYATMNWLILGMIPVAISFTIALRYFIPVN